jgi:Mn-dependent DtxR family transcriptional regulator
MHEGVSGRVEDYLKAVYEIIEQKGYARVKNMGALLLLHRERKLQRLLR